MRSSTLRMLAAAVLAIGCGARGSDDPVVNIADLECDETVHWISVEPAIAEGLVPADLALYVDEAGAQVLFIVQDCGGALWNGDQRAPLRMAHVWIRLEGPPAVAPVPGADRTLPTYYWWEHAGMTTHLGFSREAAGTGKRLDPVDAIEFTLASHGKLVERGPRNGAAPVGCTWTTTPAPPLEARLGINHLVHGRTGELILTIRDAGVIRPISYLGRSTILPTPGSVLAVFGPELHGEVVDFTMRFRAVLETTVACRDE